MATPRLLVDGAPRAEVSALDRGFTYGDGLFETIRCLRSVAPLWPRHMARLAAGCARLGLPPPDAALLLAEARTVTAGMADAVLRITLTRGPGQRGYAPPATPAVTRVVGAFPAPAPGPEPGLALALCELRLAEQPALAGIKHLNRLEQVLARAEWSDPALADGVLRDGHGRVVSTISANLFAVLDGVTVTPALDRCGVAGVARAELLASDPAIVVRDLAFEELAGASEVFLTSSVRGIRPVLALNGWHYAPGPVLRRWRQHWHDLGFPLEHRA